jgi:hypothetical protein
MVSWRVGKKIYGLERVAFNSLLSARTLSKINKFCINVILDTPDAMRFIDRKFIYIDCELVDKPHDAKLVIEKILNLYSGEKILFVLSWIRSDKFQLFLDSQGYEFIRLNQWVTKEGLFKFDFNPSKNSISTDIDSYLDIASVDIHEASVPKSNQTDIDVIKPFLSDAARSKKLIIDVQHGLGNRLRALASASSIAKKSNRELVVLWSIDHHCEATFYDLFKKSYFEVITEEDQLGNFEKLTKYNYMSHEVDSLKDAFIDIDVNSDIIVRSAFTLNSPLTDWNDENQFLKKLIPSNEVSDLIDSIDTTDMLGVHIRMEGGVGFNSAKYEQREGNWTVEDELVLQEWRAKSHFSNFFKRILKDDLGDFANFYLATDTQETYDIFLKEFGSKLHFLTRKSFDRSKENLVYALADVILLSRCKGLIGSGWSSFTELATRLSKRFDKFEQSGIDF